MRGTQRIISLCLVPIKDEVLTSIKASMPELFLLVCALYIYNFFFFVVLGACINVNPALCKS